MPFWWKRRRRWYKPFWQRKRKRWTTRRRRRRPLYKRRRNRWRRRSRKRRRRHKVRRKRQTIPVRQWQPDSIVNCHIKGMGVLVLGAEGKQLVCYTNVKQAWTPPKAPSGGGFGIEQFSLGSLYEQYKFRNNIWTKSNINKDLCRYIRVKFHFYRHPETDFIVAYERQPPFNIDEFTYSLCHPQMLMLARKKIFVLSKKTKTNGKLTKKVIIKPPKQMLTKWFFMEDFAKFPLLLLKGSAANLNYSHIGCCNKNQIVTFFTLNLSFYTQGNWAAHQSGTYTYLPYIGAPKNLVFWDIQNPTQTDFQKHGTQLNITDYNSSVDYNTGWFQTKVLTAKWYTRDKSGGPMAGAHLPTNTCRYNVNLDTGKGNAIWLHSILTKDYTKPSTDKVLILQGLPLWMMLWGWLSYVQMVKKAPDFFKTYVVLIQSPALQPLTTTETTDIYMPLDTDFVNGKPPYETTLTYYLQKNWYPNLFDQLHILNEIVKAGPFVPKYGQDRNSTWELKYMYNFFFKWGGPEVTDQPVADPVTQGIYPVPDTISQSIQIRNPDKQKFDSFIHPWDYRRGLIKKSALKRMADNMSIDSTFIPDESEPKKRKVTGPCLTVPEEENQEILQVLQELYKESTSKEAQEEADIIQLINNQREQQQQLKWNLLKLISEMKEKQRSLMLQTGLLN
nr:MAG: ORF1 [Torque teno midi virus]